jgi:hypothetical protein
VCRDRRPRGAPRPLRQWRDCRRARRGSRGCGDARRRHGPGRCQWLVRCCRTRDLAAGAAFRLCRGVGLRGRCHGTGQDPAGRVRRKPVGRDRSSAAGRQRVPLARVRACGRHGRLLRRRPRGGRDLRSRQLPSRRDDRRDAPRTAGARLPDPRALAAQPWPEPRARARRRGHLPQARDRRDRLRAHGGVRVLLHGPAGRASAPPLRAVRLALVGGARRPPALDGYPGSALGSPRRGGGALRPGHRGSGRDERGRAGTGPYRRAAARHRQLRALRSRGRARPDADRRGLGGDPSASTARSPRSCSPITSASTGAVIHTG